MIVCVKLGAAETEHINARLRKNPGKLVQLADKPRALDDRKVVPPMAAGSGDEQLTLCKRDENEGVIDRFASTDKRCAAA
jgi:hypothetical protein